MPKKEKITNTVEKPEIVNKGWQKVERSLNTHNFEENPVFCGILIEKTTVGANSTKPFDAYVFVETETGEEVYISEFHTIDTTIENVLKQNKANEVEFRFEYLGKTMVKGKPFNRFNTAYRLL